MGCSQSTQRTSTPEPAQGDGKSTLLAGSSDRKAAVDALVAAVRRSREPHHVDTSVVMCPYFAIDPKNLPLWKSYCETFYEAAKKEDGMLFYGFSEAAGGSEVHVREGFKDAASLISHLKAVDVPLQAALKLSQVKRVEVHCPAQEIPRLRAELSSLGGTPLQFFAKEPTAVMRPAEHSGEHGSDTMVSIGHYYVVQEEHLPATKKHGERMSVHAVSSEGVDHHAISVSDAGRMHVQHGYTDGAAAIAHLQSSHEHHAAGLQNHATLENLEIHGPPSEVEKIKAFFAGAASQVADVVTDAGSAVQGGAHAVGDAVASARSKASESVKKVAKSLEAATWYVLDGRAIRRAFSSTLATVAGAVSGAEGAAGRAIHAAESGASSAIHRMEHALEAGVHSAEHAAVAAGTAVSNAAASAGNTVAADARAAAAAAGRAEGRVESALEAGAQSAKNTAIAAGAAIANAATAAEQEVVADALAARAAASSVAHTTEHAIEAGVYSAEHAAVAAGTAISNAAASTGSAIAADARAAAAAAGRAEDRVESALEAGAQSAKNGAVAAGAAIASAATAAEQELVADAYAVEAAASSGANKTGQAVTAGASAAAIAVGDAATAVEGAAVVAGAAVLAVGAMAVESLCPHHIDTIVEMCPYFRIDPANLELWKAQCDAFYEHAKREDGMLFYGFCFEQSSSKVRIRMGFQDTSALLAHIRAIDVPMEAAMKLSQLDCVEIHGPRNSLAGLQEEDLKFGGQPIMWFEREEQPLRRATQHSGQHGSDATVSIGFHYEAREEGCCCSEALMPAAEGLRAQASREAGLEHHSFSFSGASAVLQQGFISAEAAIEHLVATASHHARLLQKAVLKRCEFHGPPSEVEKIKAFIAKEEQSAEEGRAHTAKVLKVAVIFTLDDKAIRRAYVGIVAEVPGDAAERGIVVESAVPPQGRGAGGWGFFSCGC